MCLETYVLSWLTFFHLFHTCNLNTFTPSCLKNRCLPKYIKRVLQYKKVLVKDIDRLRNGWLLDLLCNFPLLKISQS